MPSWSKKEDRQYEHIKQSQEKYGKAPKRAKEIAARTVNKKRREEGVTPNKITQGTGNPRHSLDSHTKDELLNQAKQLNIPGRSRMTKGELVEALKSKKRK